MRIDKEAVKTAARGRWPSILSSLGIPDNHLRNVHGPCPVCGGTKPFRFDNKNGDGTFICNHCGAGDGFTLLKLRHGWSFSDALRAVSDQLGGNHSAPPSGSAHKLTQRPPNPPDWDAYQNILNLWESGLPVTASDAAGKYLAKTRGITLDSFPKALRFTQQVQMKPGEIYKKYPAMLAAFTNQNDELVQVERFLLTPEGRKADIDKPKRFMPKWKEGSMRGGAIKLYQPIDTLAVGEGLETCLAFYSRFRVPVWATASRVFMKHVIVPNTVTKVLILADNDSNNAGQEAAETLARRLSKTLEVEIWLPDKSDTDFADLFKSKGDSK